MRFLIPATLISLVSATMSVAHDYKLGDLVIDHPVVFETPKTARAGGGFMTITNNGSSSDRLVAVEGDLPRIEIHTFEMDGDVAKMIKMENGVELPSGETVMLAPGGMHVMFMGLSEPFVEGETFPATLVFEKAGQVEIVFNVEERPERAGMNHNHSNHAEGDHSDHDDKAHDGHDH